jgi:uncharacterized sulfatase
MKRLLTVLLLALCGFTQAAEKPNIIVFYTDDHGHADLGLHGVVQDIKTPHTDALARSGVLAKHGYSTAPQCVPSRAGLLTGRFQSRFGLESNPDPLDGFNQQTTFAQRLQQVGYITAQFGKWHLGPTEAIPQHGFKHVFSQNAQRPFSANITLDGKDRAMGDLAPTEYHIDGCSKAAAALIERYQSQPFLLYIAYRAPHTPLDAPPHYMKRFPGEMPERRRAALAMLSAIDDGVGLITSTLTKHGLTEKTLIFFISDNGAPLKIHKIDSALNGDPGGWDGSLNTPLNGEKGMLSEGGIHVPFVIAWPGTIPANQVFEHPVSALDVAATALQVAGALSSEAAGKALPALDGTHLIPHLTGQIQTPPHDFLAWRWIAQSAIREGDWKLLRGGQREYLYNLAEDLEEKHNLAEQQPEIANRLRQKLQSWCAELSPPGLTRGEMSVVWEEYFDHYLEGKTIAPKAEAAPATASATDGWEARNGKLSARDGELHLMPDNSAKASFITKAKLKLRAPATAKLTFKTAASGQAAIAWRLDGDQDFLPSNRVPFAITGSTDWQTHEVKIPASGRIIHLRVHLPPGAAVFRELKVGP